MQRREEEIAGAVAGEEASRPVGSVGRRGEAEDHDPRLRVPETGHGPAPVGLVAVGGPLLPGDPLTPPHEARAEPAGYDFLLERGQLRQRRGAFSGLYGRAPA